MSSSLNKVMLIGNLGHDPEIRTTQDGKEIANLSLATTESWKDKKTGESHSKTEWHKIVVFNPALVATCKKYAKKGGKIYIEGSLQTRKWVDNNRIDRFTTEIVLNNFGSALSLLDGKQPQANQPDFTDKPEINDDIPF